MCVSLDVPQGCKGFNSLSFVIIGKYRYLSNEKHYDSDFLLHFVSLFILVITVLNGSCGKVMFLHLSVILFTRGMSGQTPPGQTLPWADIPGWIPSPHKKWPLQRTARILLEYILVLNAFSKEPLPSASHFRN